MVFANEPDGTWWICYDYQGLNAITRPAVETLPHIDALLDGTLGSRFLTKLDLASSYHQLRLLSSDRWKTSFRSQLGQFELNVYRLVCKNLTGARYESGVDSRPGLPQRLNQRRIAAWAGVRAPAGLRGVPGATGPLGRCALGYMDDCLVHLPTLEQHLLDVAEVLEIFLRRKLYAKSSKCEFGWSELGFLGHSISADGVSMHPRKVQSIMEWATPTLGAEDLRFAASRDWPTTTDDSSKGMLRSPHR